MGALPLDTVRFLDYATERIFLRQVGGGYYSSTGCCRTISRRWSTSPGHKARRARRRVQFGKASHGRGPTTSFANPPELSTTETRRPRWSLSFGQPMEHQIQSPVGERPFHQATTAAEPEGVNLGETDRLGNCGVGRTSVGLLIQAWQRGRDRRLTNKPFGVSGRAVCRTRTRSSRPKRWHWRRAARCARYCRAAYLQRVHNLVVTQVGPLVLHPP